MSFSQRKRRAVLDAAAECFRRQGYRETSMDRIAETAGVSKRTVYRHFPGKEDLFHAVAHELMMQQHNELDADYRPRQKLRAQLIRAATREVGLFSSDDYVSTARVLLIEALNDPALMQRVFREAAGFRGPVRRWIEAACEDGRLSMKDQNLATTQLLSMLKGSLYWPLVMSLRESIPDAEQRRVIAACVDMFLDHHAVRENAE